MNSSRNSTPWCASVRECTWNEYWLGLATRDVYALTRIPVSAGPVTAAVDYTLNGQYAETVVVPGLVAGHFRCGIPYEDAVASRAKDVVALD